MVTEESISHYWNYAELLNEQLGKTANYVEPDKHNYGTYSTTYTNILLSACSEIEVVAKMICQIIDPDTDYLICLDGFFSKEELIEMAQSLVKTAVPKS